MSGQAHFLTECSALRKVFFKRGSKRILNEMDQKTMLGNSFNLYTGCLFPKIFLGDTDILYVKAFSLYKA